MLRGSLSFTPSSFRLFGSIARLFRGARQLTSPLVGLSHRLCSLLRELFRAATLPDGEGERAFCALPFGFCGMRSLLCLSACRSLDLHSVLSRLGAGNRSAMCGLGLRRGCAELEQLSAGYGELFLNVPAVASESLRFAFCSLLRYESGRDLAASLSGST